MSNKHTPGPYSVEPFERKDGNGSGLAICHGEKKPIAWLYQISPNAFGDMKLVPIDQAANARLFAAAPEMLEALKAIQAVSCDPDGVVCVSGSDGDRQVIAEALKVIAKAEGQDK